VLLSVCTTYCIYTGTCTARYRRSYREELENCNRQHIFLLFVLSLFYSSPDPAVHSCSTAASLASPKKKKGTKRHTSSPSKCRAKRMYLARWNRGQAFRTLACFVSPRRMCTRSMRSSKFSDKEAWELYQKVSETEGERCSSGLVHRDIIAIDSTFSNFLYVSFLSTCIALPLQLKSRKER
jgi:hypothetical protein